MLSDRQKSIINNLPVEGGCHYFVGGNKIAYDERKAFEIALKPLHNKIKPDVKLGTILHGAPGSGKSKTGLDRLFTEHIDTLDSTAIISYDEEGAIYDIPEYVAALKEIVPEFVDQHTPLSPERALETMEARHKLWLEFQPLSQYIRSLTLKQALHRELSLFIDTTSSSPATFKMIDTLRQLDYDHIEAWSTFGPLDLAKERILQRARPTSVHDTLVKRVGAYETLPGICAGEVDRVVVSVNGAILEDILVLEAGRPVDMNLKELNKLRNRLVQESGDFAENAKTHLSNMPNLDQRYNAAVENLNSYLLTLAPDSKRRPILTLRGMEP